VQTYRCAETPPTDDYDWYGRCEPGGETMRFTLDLLQETGYTPVSAGETTTGGEFHIAGLVPGTYHLDAVDSTWCHAESDHVDAQGDLVVDAGSDVTVWIFFCPQSSGS
jgi:hypothetical protein